MIKAIIFFILTCFSVSFPVAWADPPSENSVEGTAALQERDEAPVDINPASKAPLRATVRPGVVVAVREIVIEPQGSVLARIVG